MICTSRVVRRYLCPAAVVLALAMWPVLAPSAHAQGARMGTAGLPTIVEVINGHTRIVRYRDRPALQLIVSPDQVNTDSALLAIIDGPLFTDGSIELSLVGVPRADAPADSRGFVGLSFRTGPRGEWSEVFYLRPLNARADDQRRRNHTVQYVSEPAFPWHRLREQQPGTYESYADMEPGAWTTMRVVVSGTTARLFVNGASQPCLVVTDLKHGAGGGRVALSAHAQTGAYFGPVSIVRR